MVTWSRSFVVAFKILLVSLIWYVVGLIITLMGIAIMGVGALLELSRSAATPEEAFARLGGLLAASSIFLIAGILVAVLGVMATQVKFIVDEAVEEARRLLRPLPSPPSPPESKAETGRKELSSASGGG